MAERRMFAKTIIDSDAFIDMPVTARLLYYDLAMRADDDGFVNAPKKITRMIGASQDDLSLLALKKFIIPFDNGVVVIKHWRIHNYIRGDTYKETQYKEQKELLEFDENKAYRQRTVNEPSTDSLRTVDDPSTQDRIGEDRIGEDRIGEDRGLADASPRCPYSKIKDLYHEICKSYPKLKGIEGKRKEAVKARWTAHPDIDIFRELFTKAEASDFMKGQNDRNWRADFDFLMNPSKFSCILEGKYDNRKDNNQNEDNPYNFLWD